MKAANSAAAQSLLAYLLLNQPGAHSRQHLAFRLWPDSTDSQAQANLRTLLARVRRAWPEADTFLQIEQRFLQWRGDAPLLLDVIEFETAVTRANQSLNSNPITAQADFARAVGVYRGDLLPECYEDWILPERERLRQIFLTALQQLIDLMEKQRDFGAALGCAQRLLQFDPLDETAYRHVMRLHALRGDRAGVIRVFDTCATILQRELAVDPSPSTREAYESLLRMEPPSPPARSSGSTTHNLPYVLTGFIGRGREREALKQLQQTARLITLTGPGGSGKTRLALQLAFETAPQYPQGTWWVDLASLADPWMVSRTLASVLEVQEQADRPLLETLAAAIGDQRVLLILDNCEHLIAECALVASRLLSECPQLTILATSREPLGLAGEAVYAIAPLPLPPDAASAGQAEAVQLFVERAALTLPTFALTQHNQDAIVQICRRLDGIPLAIELAAARVKVLSVDQIARRLDDRFDLLVGGDRAALPRHQTLKALVDWSYDLLSGPEQALFRKLAVFAGGFTLEAAEAIGGPETDRTATVLVCLSHLIDKSLVVAEEAAGGAMRYRMLEMIRQYALDRLVAADEMQQAREGHADFFARLAETAAPHLQIARQQSEWLARLESDQDNLRAVLGWCIKSHRTELALSLVGHLGWFWVLRSDFIEGRQWVERACALPEAERHPRAYARALVLAGILACLQTEAAESKSWLEQGLALARAHADRLTAADALNFLGLVALWERDVERARACLEESRALFHELEEWAGYARTAWHLGWVMEREGQAAPAVLAQYELALALLREWGDPLRQSHVLRSIGWNQYELGDRAGGRESLRESLALVQSVGHKAGIAHSLRAIAERIEADPERAVRLLMVVIRLCHTLGLVNYEQAVSQNDLLQRRTQLDEAAFAGACEAGRVMTIEQAIQDALSVE